MLVGSFAASAIVHLAVGFPARDFINDYLSSARPPPEKPIKIVRLSPEQWQRNRRTDKRAFPSFESQAQRDALEKERLPLEEKKRQKEKRPRGQIVEVPPTADDRPNPNAKYLSKYNSHVDKETVARPDARDHSMKRVTNKLQRREVAGRPDNALPTKSLTVKGDDSQVDRPGKTGDGQGTGKDRFVLEVPDMKRQDGVKLKLSELPGVSQRLANRQGSDELRGNSERFRLEMGDGLEDGGGEGGKKKGSKDGAESKLPNLAALVPTIGTVARISGSPSRDHVEGVPEGDGTFLNTKEFKYATFFYRVRDSVASYWEDLAAQEYRRRDPTGNIYGVRDRSTLLHIQLTRDGRLDHVRIEQTSGVEFLDTVAVQAFRMAEPFPNPPPGIVEDDGSIRFNFQFVVTMRSRGPFNLFR